MRKHTLLKQLSIGIVSLVLICPLVLSPGENANAKARHSRITRVQSHKRNLGFKIGLPKILNHTEWKGQDHYYYQNHHLDHYKIKLFGSYSKKDWSNSGFDGGVYYYNRHHKMIGGSAGFDLWWKPFYKYVGHHTYKIVTGDGDTNTNSMTLTKHGLREGKITTIKVLNKKTILVNGKVYKLAYKTSDK